MNEWAKKAETDQWEDSVKSRERVWHFKKNPVDFFFNKKLLKIQFLPASESHDRPIVFLLSPVSL